MHCIVLCKVVEPYIEGGGGRCVFIDKVLLFLYECVLDNGHHHQFIEINMHIAPINVHVAAQSDPLNVTDVR